MRTAKTVTIIAALLAGVFVSLAQAKPASVLLQEALYAEEVDGNVNGAVKIYQEIIADASAQNTHKAQAMYRLGNCYLKLKDEQQAKTTFQNLMAKYPDQTQLMEKVKPILDELTNADPAALMPAETLIYIELGSPGKQVETILNMLKGTPFENPLAMVGGGKGAGGPGGARSPQDIIGALLNPSMMAEFKKIRGMGIGITGISQNNPPGIMVLFPGKSDALRGIILAALGMVGRPVESIEGLQTLALGDGVHAAYDDTAVIISFSDKDSAGQLARTIKQYKGTAISPNLASHNKSFTRISKKDREQNLLTMWANVDELYVQLLKQFPDGWIPDQLRAAQGILDITNIDDFVAFVSLQEHNVALQADVIFKDGHHCLAYDLIRTPNLSKAGFEAVPSDAVALLSFALGSAESAQARAASAKIQQFTGLDIGREIFGNIEQVTLFAVPTAKTGPAASAIHPMADNIGLAITSHNPKQTRQLLSTLLGVANLVAGGTQPTAGESVGRFQIGLVNNQQLYCFLEQASKTTLLALNPDIVEAAVSAVKGRRSVLQAGPLKETVNGLPNSTSKLVLINVGGAIRLAGPVLAGGAANENLQQAIAQLAKTCENTNVQLRTDEELNSLSLRAGIAGLPPINQLLDPIMQVSKLMDEAQRQTRAERGKAMAPADIAKTSQAPTINPQVEEIWSQARQYELKNVLYSPLPDTDDCSARFKALWDENNLYLLVDVTDDKLVRDSGDQDWWKDDAIEVFIDADNSKSGEYGDNDFQFHVAATGGGKLVETRHGDLSGAQYVVFTTPKGYCAKFALSWSMLKGKPTAGTTIGLDIHVTDDDDGGERDSKLTWHGKADNAWVTPSAFGNAQVIGLVGWWKLDESEGATAADSSGNGHDGTLHGNPRWVPSGGKAGGALEFDCVDDYVDTGYAGDLPTWTVAVWVKSPAAPSSDAKTSGPVHREKNYQINWNHIMDAFRGAAGVCVDGVWYPASFGELQANTWYYLVATYDGENLKAYKDGVLVTDNSAPSGNPNTESETLKFARHARSTSYFGGSVDDVRIYNYALGPADIATLYAGK